MCNKAGHCGSPAASKSQPARLLAVAVSIHGWHGSDSMANSRGPCSREGFCTTGFAVDSLPKEKCQASDRMLQEAVAAADPYQYDYGGAQANSEQVIL